VRVWGGGLSVSVGVSVCMLSCVYVCPRVGAGGGTRASAQRSRHAHIGHLGMVVH